MSEWLVLRFSTVQGGVKIDQLLGSVRKRRKMVAQRLFSPFSPAAQRIAGERAGRGASFRTEPSARRPPIGAPFGKQVESCAVDLGRRLNESQNRGSDVQVLIADTDELFLEILQRYLCRQGYATEIAASGHECARKLRNLHLDVFVVDHALSSQFHGGVSELMATTHWMSSIRVVLIGDSINDFGSLPSSPLIFYLRKPFKLRDLLTVISVETENLPLCCTEHHRMFG